MHVHCLLQKVIVSAYTTEKWQDDRGSVMPWETLGPGIHVNITLTRNNYLTITKGQVHPIKAMIFSNGSGLLQ